MKLPSFCLLLVLFGVHLDGMSAQASKNYIPDARECLSGISPSACNKRLLLLPLPPRGSRRLSESTFSRSPKGFGLIKQPRVGRSDPDNRWTRDAEDDTSTWLDGNRDYGHSTGSPAYHRPVSGEKDEILKNLEYYLSTQRRDSPWAFFLITPNFQNMEHSQAADNFFPQLDNEIDDAGEK